MIVDQGTCGFNEPVCHRVTIVWVFLGCKALLGRDGERCIRSCTITVSELCSMGGGEE